MKLEHEFSVAAPMEETWSALLDVERVAGCLPGATVQSSDEPGVYQGQMKVKLGPMTIAYKGTLRMEEVDEAARRAVMRIQAKELKGQGGALARMESRLARQDGRTRVVVSTDLDVSGRAAQLGRGMMENVAGRLLTDFAQRLERELASAPEDGGPSPEPAAVEAGGAQTLSADAGPAAPRSRTPKADPASSPPSGEMLDLGRLVATALSPRQRALAVGALAVGCVLLLAVRGRHRPVGVVLSFRSGWLGRQAEIRLGR